MPCCVLVGDVVGDGRLLVLVFLQNVEVLDFHLFVFSAKVLAHTLSFLVVAEALHQNLIVELQFFHLLRCRLFFAGLSWDRIVRLEALVCRSQSFL